MMDSLLTPSTSSHMQTPATTFDHEDFLNHIFASAPWPSVDETHAPQPPPSDGFVDSRNQQIMMMPLSSHHQNDNVDGSSAHALYNGFSATGSRPFHIPQVINLNKSLSLSRFRSWWIFFLGNRSWWIFMMNLGVGRWTDAPTRPKAKATTTASECVHRYWWYCGVSVPE